MTSIKRERKDWRRVLTAAAIVPVAVAAVAAAVGAVRMQAQQPAPPIPTSRATPWSSASTARR